MSTEIIKDFFTERDNITFCVARLVLTVGGFAMVWNFVVNHSTDYQNFGIGLAALGAAIALKNMSEK